MRVVVVLLAAIGSIASIGFAQDPQPSEASDTTDVRPFWLREIRVSVTRGSRPLERTPAAISVVEGRSIQGAQPTVGIHEALASVPGLIVSNRHNFALDSRVSIRGFGARAGFGVRGVRLIVDGIPLTSPDGQATLNNLNPGTIGRMEVIRGPSSSLYGNAAGGVISMETEDAPAVPFAMEARVLFGNQGTSSAGALRKLQGKVGGRVGQVDYIASLARLDMDGFRAHSRTEHTHFNARARYALTPTSYLAVVLNAADMPVAQNPGALALEDAQSQPEMAWPQNQTLGAGKVARQVQGGVTYARAVGEDRLDVSVYGVSRDMENPLTFGRINLDRQGAGLRATYRTEGTLGGLGAFAIAGVDGELQRDERREHAIDDEGNPTTLTRNQLDRVYSVGPFVQGQVQLRPDLEATLGMRADIVRFRTTDRPQQRENPDGIDDSGDRRLSAFSYTLGLAHALRPELNLYANVGTAFESPTTTELINAPPAGDDRPPAPGFNPSVDPERALSFEIGARGLLSEWLRYDVAAYTMDVRDRLVPFQVEQAPGRDFYTNAGRSRHRGIELGLSARPLPAWTAELAYTFSRFTFVDYEIDEDDYGGNRFPGVPPHRLFGSVLYQHRSGVFAETRVELVDEFFVDDANEHSNPSYQTVDLRLGFERRFGSMELAPFIGIGNLFNERYSSSVVVNAFGGRYFEPAPGRNLYMGVTVPYGWGSRDL